LFYADICLNVATMSEKVESLFPKYQVLVRIPASVPSEDVEFWYPEFETAQSIRAHREVLLGGKVLESHGTVRPMSDDESARIAELADVSVDTLFTDKELLNNLGELTIPQLAIAVRAIHDATPYQTAVLGESAKKLDRLHNINKLLGLLAPGGTAPRTGFEQLWEQAGENAEESPILLELRHMLSTHWGEWTPALRKAEGLPPVDTV